MKTIAKTLAASLLLFSNACSSGGGDSDSSVVFQGTLIQGADVSHARQISSLAHTANEPIEEVQICARGECSVTDSNGQWGFRVENPTSEILFSAIGHSINSTFTITIPSTAKDVFLELENHEEGVHTHSVVVDGANVEETHSEEADEHNHNE